MDFTDETTQPTLVRASDSVPGVHDPAARQFLARRSFPPSRLKPFWPQAEAAALSWLKENGCPQPGDGNQAILETAVADWLAEHGYDASESAIRRHVRKCMTRYRETL